jgi:STE24 endopeptidase
LLISPIFIEPMFNTYKPITDPAISEPILELARVNKIPVTQVFEVDASRQTKRISANVAGFLGTTRIALNDNLLKQCTLPEIRHVMGHEMGHYVLNHTGKLILFLGTLILLGFLAARASFGYAVRHWGNQWGVRGIDDPAGLPLLMLIMATVFFVTKPAMTTAIRTIEIQADAFALKSANEPDGAARVALKLGAYRKLDPGALEEFLFFDHPSGRARIRMAMDWKAANAKAQ